MIANRSHIALLVAILAAFSMWCYVDFILVPYEKMDAAEHDRPRGNLSDLYPRWLGARELLLHGRDPYSPDITRDIQVGYYGRPLNPSRPNDPKDQQGFAYPVYVAFLLGPTVRLPFGEVQTGFRWLLVLLIAATIPLWAIALRLRLTLTNQLTWLVFALGSFSAVQGLKLQQLTLVVCALIAGCAAALSRGRLVAAGVLLALATIKPQLAGILAAWLLFWTLNDWRRRQLFAWSFGGSMLLLVGGSELLLPGWIGRFRAAAAAYYEYTGGGKSVLDVILGAGLGKLTAAILLVVVCMFLWKYRRDPADSAGFGHSFALVLAFTLVVIPSYAPYNQLLLLPALMLLVRSHSAETAASTTTNPERSVTRSALINPLRWITLVVVSWPWVSAGILDLLLFVLPPHQVQSHWTVPLYTSLPIPLAVLGTLMVGSLPSSSTGLQSVVQH